MFQHLLFFLQNLVGNVIGNRMEAVVDDDMEVDQEIVVIPVKDEELLEAYSTSHGVTTTHLNNNSKPSEAVVCKICSLKVTSMAALERHQKAKHQNISFTCAECGISKDSRRKLTDHLITHKTFICPNCDKVMSLHSKSSHMINLHYTFIEIMNFDTRKYKNI